VKNDYYSNSNDYINRWVISYADFVTMLLALFMIMFATSGLGDAKMKDVNKSIQKVFASKTVETTKSNENIAQEITEEENVKNVEIKKENTAPIENNGETILDGQNGILDAQKVMEQINQDFKADMSIKVIKSDRGVVIRLNDTMLFDAGSAIIKPEAMTTLSQLALSLNKFQNPILIEGHTDSMPISSVKYPSNWELSTARATNIIKYLIGNHHFPPSRLSAVGYGEYMPVEKNDTPQGRAKNRRVDIIILSTDKNN
jgi:chemotaxis protein MotB